MEIINTLNNLDLLRHFLNNSKNARKTFRYFESRPLSIVENHIESILFIVEGKPVCYGHLDPDENKVWLGIAVSDSNKGNGFGKKMMIELVNRARMRKISTISLSVDKENTIAKDLYLKLGFQIESVINNRIYMNLELT